MSAHPVHRLIWLLMWRSGHQSSISPLGHKLSPPPSPSEQGLTIMECLVAVLLIVITIALVAPPLVLATATRVQNRRAEQALQVAQGEIDRIRVRVAMGLHDPNSLPTVAAGTTAATLPSVAAPSRIDSRIRTLNSTGASCANRYDPNSNTAADSAAPAVDTLVPVDVDGDCVPEYLMQVFRTSGLVSTTERAPGRELRPSEFDVGVRIYPIQATAKLAEGLGITPAPLLLTSSTQRKRPLAALYSKFVWTEEQTSLCSYFPQADRQRIASCSGVYPNGSP